MVDYDVAELARKVYSQVYDAAGDRVEAITPPLVFNQPGDSSIQKKGSQFEMARGWRVLQTLYRQATKALGN